MRRPPIYLSVKVILHGLVVPILLFTVVACTPATPLGPASPSTAAAYPAPDASPTLSSNATAYPQASSLGTPEASAPQETTLAASKPTATRTSAPSIPTGFPDPAQFTWQAVAGGFTRPVAVSGDGFGNILVEEQPGRIQVIEGQGKRAQPFLDITDRVGSKENEQGLLGLALHPQYAQNGYVYVNYTDVNGNTVVSRFTADPRAAVANPESEKILLHVTQPFANHNGGCLLFGPDGYLYIGLGDGGSADDPNKNGQNPNTLLGKLLRIDVDGGDPYSIPADNPFASGGGKPEIWALGLRNPWRFSFDSQTGDLYIGDVGQNTWEEVDFQPAGARGGTNYGWNLFEGSHPFQGQPRAGVILTDPIFEYKHPEGCSITGGRVYRGTQLPEFAGIYLVADYCTQKTWGLYRDADGKWQSRLLFQGGLNISGFGVDDHNELYAADHGNGFIMKLSRK